MGNYSVGNLEMSVQSSSDMALASLDKMISRLTTVEKLVTNNSVYFKSLRDTLSGISKMKFNSLDKLANGITSISNINAQSIENMKSVLSDVAPIISKFSINLGDTSNLNGVGNFAKGIEKLSKVDVEQFNTQIQELTVALKPFLNEISGKETALTSFANAMNSVGKSTAKNIEKVGQQQKKGGFLGLLNNANGIFGKINYFKNNIFSILNSTKKMLTYAIDYTETLNLWQVAMGKNVKTAETFIKKMNEAYGISEETLMRYQATFKNMLSSLGGMSDNVSYQLSEYLSQMALDYASLYNTSIERAMTVFESVLSGQVRPVRSKSGYDITETTIYQLYQQMGGTKTQRQLTQTEKRLLRLYAVFVQMERSGAVGDLNKTFDNTANQLRIATETAKEFATWIGRIFEIYLKPVLPYINGILISIKTITETIARSLPGYEDFDGTISGFEDVNEEITKLNGNLLSFDRFESLSSKDTEGVGTDFADKLLDATSKYKQMYNQVGGKAKEFAKKITDFFVEVDENGVSRITPQGQIILDIIKAITFEITGLLVLGIAKKIINLVKWLTGAGNKLASIQLILGYGIVYSIIKIFKYIEEGKSGLAAVWAVITVILSAMLVLTFRTTNFTSALQRSTNATRTFSTALGQTNLSMMKFGGIMMTAMALAIEAGQVISSWGDMNTAGRIISVIGMLTTAFFGLGMALGFVHSAKAGIAGLAIGASFVTLAGMMKKEANTPIKQHKTGGRIEDGLFTMNKGEIAGKFDDGTTIVANNQQIIQGIKRGVYSAVVSAMKDTNGNRTGGNVYMDGRKVGYTVAKSSYAEQVRLGYVKIK